VLAATSLWGQRRTAGSLKICLGLVKGGCHVSLRVGKTTRRQVTKADAE
jgi:hypothetical protein